MKEIGWIQISSRKYGGGIYEERLKEILDSDFNFEPVNINSKTKKTGYARIPEILWEITRTKGKKDLWIRDMYTSPTLGFDKTSGKNMVIIHHIDFSQSRGLAKIIDFFIGKIIYASLKKADVIVTVSEYWKNHFQKLGYRNVYKIYNSFDVSDFNISDSEVADFKRKYNLSEKPVIYIGNCQEAKGVREVYQALKDLDVTLVTSGEEFVKIPALNLNLEYKDYLRLLKASTLAVIMSKIKEGWCRTAHEAMLLKTPVIGSGLGGMGELLEGGKQIISPDFSSLREKVEYLLDRKEVRENMGEQGYEFAKGFTKERFKADWLNLIENID